MSDGRSVIRFGPTPSGGAVFLIEQDGSNNVGEFQAFAQTVVLDALLTQHQQHQSKSPAERDAPSGGAVFVIEQDGGNNVAEFQAFAQTVRLAGNVTTVRSIPSGGVTPPTVTTTAVRPQKATVLSG